VYLVASDRTWLSLRRHLRAPAVRELVAVMHARRLCHYHHLLRLALLPLPLLSLYVNAVWYTVVMAIIGPQQSMPRRHTPLHLDMALLVLDNEAPCAQQHHFHYRPLGQLAPA